MIIIIMECTGDGQSSKTLKPMIDRMSIRPTQLRLDSFHGYDRNAINLFRHVLRYIGK